MVACQQLGAGIAYDVPRTHSFGSNPNISIAMSNAVCIGPEGRLQNCGGRFGSRVDSSCTHNNDVGLVCIDASKCILRMYVFVLKLLAGTLQHSYVVKHYSFTVVIH